MCHIQMSKSYNSYWQQFPHDHDECSASFEHQNHLDL